ncbi:MAG: SDR family oxidoreductase [Ardenticatenia bacterium]|nr:MAG: SDR family oxidoreductase [Ardenticatenia bacterium]
MKIDLTGKTALVTGGNVGIGAGIVRALAACGAEVALTYFSNREAAEKTVAEVQDLGGRAHMFQLDATKSEHVNQVVNDAAQALGGRIDILVNNAGHLIGRVPTSEMSDEHWHKVIDTNLSSAFYVTRATLPFMPEGGRIVNMSSLAARNGGGNGAVAYAAAKAGILGFTRGLAKELAPRKITVNALAPGFIVDTPFHETFTGRENFDRIVQNIPLKRAGLPKDVAGAVLYFVSELGEWVTGQVAEINGGAWFV